MRHRFNNFLILLLGGTDFITMNLIVIVAMIFLRVPFAGEYQVGYLQYFALLNFIWFIVCAVGNVYSDKYIFSFESFARITMKALLFWIGLIVIVLFFTRQVILSRALIFVTLTSFGIMLLVNRFIYLIFYQYFRKKEYIIKKVLILGYNDVAKKLTSYLEDEGMNVEVVGYCEDSKVIHELTNYPIVGNIKDAMTASRDFSVNEIFSTISPEQEPFIYSLMQKADDACIRFKLIPDLSYFIKGNFHIGYLKDFPVLSLRTEPLDELSSRIKKRFIDIVVSLLVVIFILSWLIPLLAFIIKLESKGPVFFIQDRSGKDNKTFKCIKFRSMRTSKEANVKQATRNDSRLTNIGRILRKTNLDEFPQFINVLIGNMSLVGPRPHMLKHTNDYSKLIGKYMVRQFLKPGITGWAQVNGLRGETKTLFQMQQRVEHDIWYMENWSLWLDLKILFLTIYTTINGDDNAF